MTLATQEDGLIRLERRPGQYVVACWPLVMVWPGDRVSEEFEARVNSTFALGNQRTSARMPSLPDMIVRGAREGLPEGEDRREAEDRYSAAIQALREPDVPNYPRLDTARRDIH